MSRQAAMRRRRLSFLGILLLTGVLATALLAFTRPTDNGGPGLRVSLASLLPGQPMPHVVDGLGGDGAAAYAVWLVRDGDDNVRAFLGRDPFSGCRVEWDARYDLVQVNSPDPNRERGAFKAFCSGWVFLADGRVVFGAASRGLDEYDVTVDGDRVRVSFERVTLGQCAEGQGLARGLCSLPGTPVYADLPPPPQVPR
jgi:nitrite reductase/ring-hydroxylating ferredoxin subunit